MKILTGTQHAELDRYTIEHEPVASIDLMERAATRLVDDVMQRWDWQRIFYIFAGPGNNGGDGLAMARIMAQKGYRVVTYLFNVKNKLSEDCQTNRDRLIELCQTPVGENLMLIEVTQGFDFPKVRQRDIVIDALFGTGLSKPLSGGFAGVVRKINTLHCTVVSIDTPSGLMCEDNEYIDRSTVINASLTLTIQLPKLAFLFSENERCVGQWKTIDIALSAEGIEQLCTPYSIMEKKEVAELLQERSAFAHKGTMGHALLVVGSYGMAGAAQLSAKACLRSGIGKLTLHSPACNNTILQITVPEAILTPDKDKQVVSEAYDINRFQAIGIGPGLGLDDQTASALEQYLAMADSPVVLDADAINLLALHRNWLSHLPAGSILTPHVGELENLIGRCSNSLERLNMASALAVKHNLYILVKGHYTAICTPNGRVRFCPRGNAGMATPGSGDVLAGLITGLLAQGYAPMAASMLGVWLHATAGDLAAEELTEECMLASDIITHLPRAFRELRMKNKE